MNDIIRQRKPISICLTTNHIEPSTDTIYQITPSELNIEEDVQILKLYYTLHQLFVDALNQPDLIFHHIVFQLHKLNYLHHIILIIHHFLIG